MSGGAPGRGAELALVFALVFVTGVGTVAGLVTTQRHYELEEKLPIAVPASCKAAAHSGHADACEDALMHPTWGALLGLPVAAWGAATHLAALGAAWMLALGLAFGRPRLAAGALTALSALALVAVLGTASFLVVGLGILGVKCVLCLTMHALNGGLAALVLFAARGPWRGLGAAQVRRAGSWAVGGGAGVAVAALAFLSSSAYASRYAGLAAEGERLQPAYDQWVGRACETLECPAEVVFSASHEPSASESIVLAEGRGAITMVELLDMSCQSCEDHHRYLGPVYRELIAAGEVGVRLVLWPANRDCNPNLNRRLHYQACSSNLALWCAHRHGQVAKALAFMDWEMSVGRQVHTAPDRVEWLRREVSPVAAACVEEQIARGVDSALAPHLTWALGMMKKAAGRAFCGGEGDGWWCMNGTPSFAVFSEKASTYEASQVAATARAASGRPRVMHVRGCLP